MDTGKIKGLYTVSSGTPSIFHRQHHVYISSVSAVRVPSMCMCRVLSVVCGNELASKNARRKRRVGGWEREVKRGGEPARERKENVAQEKKKRKTVQVCDLESLEMLFSFLHCCFFLWSLILVLAWTFRCRTTTFLFTAMPWYWFYYKTMSSAIGNEPGKLENTCSH